MTKYSLTDVLYFKDSFDHIHRGTVIRDGKREEFDVLCVIQESFTGMDSPERQDQCMELQPLH